jgi:DNA-binding PadR family transcriptional regulator
MLELAILGLLQEQELHGYELKKRLGETLGPFSGASFGSLYPALRRLEASGAVKAVEANATPVTPSRPMPMTGSLGGELAAFRAAARRSAGVAGGRAKKVYGITERGQELFEELLAGEAVGGPDDDRTFNLKLAFARFLPTEARLRLLERRRAHLVERLARAPRRTGLDRYRRSLLEHTNESTERDISWLDRLIEAEKGSPS